MVCLINGKLDIWWLVFIWIFEMWWNSFVEIMLKFICCLGEFIFVLIEFKFTTFLFVFKELSWVLYQLKLEIIDNKSVVIINDLQETEDFSLCKEAKMSPKI
jgi:hypothetical protein